MQGTIIQLRLGNSYEKEFHNKPITTIRLDNSGEDSKFDVAGELGKLGDKVEITATVKKQ